MGDRATVPSQCAPSEAISWSPSERRTSSDDEGELVVVKEVDVDDRNVLAKLQLDNVKRRSCHATPEGHCDVSSRG